VLELALDGHLLVYFGAEAGHEGLQDHAHEHQRVQDRVYHLLATDGVRLLDGPGLVLLDVLVAVTAHLHSSSQSVLQLRSFHQLAIPVELLEQLRYKGIITVVSISSVGWHNLLQGA